MAIERIESFFKDQVCLVRITDSDGAVGYGQTAPFAADITQMVLHRQVAPLAIGRDETDFSLSDSLINALHKFTGTYVCRAVAGVDTAMWDLKGKKAGKSVSEMLGSQKSHVEMYYSSMIRDCPIEWEAERIDRLRKERGYKAFKLHVGKWNSEGEDYWPGRTEAMIKLASDTLQGNGELYIDPNGAFGYDWSMQLAPLMRDCGVTILEEPLPFWKIAETARLRKDIAPFGLHMAGGEQDYNPNAWDMILALPMADIIQPDIGYIGGFTRTLAVAERAAQKGIFTTPHTSNCSLLLHFGLHLNASIAKPWITLEHGVEEDRWAHEIYEEELTVIDGKIAVPTAPGWGVSISEDWLRHAHYQETH